MKINSYYQCTSEKKEEALQREQEREPAPEIEEERQVE